MSARLQTLGKLEAKVVCQYVWGARQGHRDELILRDRDATTSGSESSGEFLNERQWCLMDYYDPTSIVDNSANVVERYRFSAFGLRTVMSAGFTPLDTSGYDWDFAFKGQFLDLDTGYYNYGYRYYSPEPGRWLSRDPIGEQGGTHIYCYLTNNTLNLNDPFGLLPSCTGRIRLRSGGCKHRTTRPAPGYVPTANGCGAEGGAQFPDTFNVFVPNDPRLYARSGRGGGTTVTYSIRSACDSHDICYGTCGRSKHDCDNQFWNDISAICDSLTSSYAAGNCRFIANTYYNAVSSLGEDAYQAGQDEGCEWEPCCPRSMGRGECK